jgi:3-dehydroquinate dehydratase
MPVAYHLLGRHPGDGQFAGTMNTSTRIRIPADEIIHLFITERSDQSRGLPWLVASMQGMKMLDGYAEAELVAARTGAAKMGFFTKKTPDGWDGEVDGDGNLSMDASPGTIEELPAGVEFKEWSTDHPNSGYGDFVKSRLRGIATSLGISYNTLASDLEGVNYSSIRAGLIEEREVWKAIQRFLIEHCVEDIFTEWLSIELLSGRLGLPFEKITKFNQPEFQGKRWAWVDPKKDMEASILGIRSGQTPLRKVVSENGGDIYDVLRSIKADNDLAASLGVTLPELVEAMPVALASGYGGVRSGRTRDLPDTRTVRWYQTLGMVDRPAAFRGRTALYGRRHLLQLAAIKKLQSSGLPLADIQRALIARGTPHGITIDFVQSNHEGVIIDTIQQQQGLIDGIIINPGAFTHYSYAIRDALSAVSVPILEVHISNVYKREPFRHHSVIAAIATGQIAGLGWRGYVYALDWFIDAAASA